VIRPIASHDIVTVVEHAPIPISDGAGPGEITASEAERLLRIGARRRGFCTREYGAVRVAQFCGVVSLGARLLEVLPKTHTASEAAEARSMVVRMLRLVGSAGVFRDIPAGHSRVQERLLDVFIAAFFDCAAALARGGLLKQYRALADDIRVVRGRVNASRQFGALANRTDIVACAFDELDVDNRWNRIVKSGIVTAMGWTGDVELRRRGLDLLSGLDEVATVPLEQLALDRVTFDRAGERYRRAVEWVRLIAATQSPAIRAGDVHSHGLLFDMNRLFERAVARVLSAALTAAGQLTVTPQDHDEYLARVSGGKTRHFPLRPDLVIRQGERVVALADTKWKILRVSPLRHLVPTNADVYQMVAYASTFGASELALIYPWQAGLEGSAETAYRLRAYDGRKVTLHVMCMRMEADGMPVVRGQGFLEALGSRS
jgi:5-methylcytosine-specific restriction enzyme subunit McrC